MGWPSGESLARAAAGREDLVAEVTRGFAGPGGLAVWTAGGAVKLNLCRRPGRVYARHPQGDADVAWGDVRALRAGLVTGFLLADPPGH